jgi:hypothetical protein
MKISKNEIEEKVRKIGELDSRQTQLVKLSLAEFVDRIIETERRWVETEFRQRDAALEAHVRINDLRHETGDAKIQKADAVLEYRMEEMNNFRAQINQERAEYLRREMYEREQGALAERVKNLEIVRGEQSGKTAAYASMVGFVVVVVQIILHFWK